MSLASVIERLQNQPLTADEIVALKEFERSFEKEFRMDDDDPLMVVLALLARNRLIIETMPNLLQQKANETIEMHRVVLRDQSVAISKELLNDLIAHIKLNLYGVDNGFRSRLVKYFGCFVGGLLVASAVFWAFRHFLSK